MANKENHPVEGSKLILIKDIYDDGEDHHPPSFLAYMGDVVVVKTVWGSGRLAVAHEGNTGAFSIYPGEYKMMGNT